jgi:lysophospholipase L1-like esterase
MSARSARDKTRRRAPLVGRRMRAGGAAMVVMALLTLVVPPALGKQPRLVPRAEQGSAALYVALGDSVAAGAGTYVGLLFPHYQSTLGVTQLSNRAVSGATSGSLRTGGQLDRALADITAASDTRAVTIDIGGNDGGECAGSWDSCPFRYNFFATLSDLRAALDSDPGPESFAAMAYYNPASGLGGDGPNSEPYYDRGLLGTDLAINCEITAGPQVGINDVIYQEAGRRGAWVADPYLAFKEGGQAFMADSLHPNDAGHAAIAAAFREASPQCPEADKLPLPTPPPPPPPPPSNDFSFGNAKKNKRKGTARLTVNVSGPGAVDLAKTKKMKADGELAEVAGIEKLAVRPRRKAKTKLAATGKAKIKAIVTYTPHGGEPNTQTKRLRLIKRS